MSNQDYLFRQLIMLVPFGLAQLGIALTLVAWAKERFSARGVATAIVIAVSAGLFQFITVLMDLCPRFWPAVRPLAPYFDWMRTTTFTWMMASSTAYLIFVIFRFLFTRRAERTDPSRRRLIQSVGAVAVAAPFVAETFGIVVGRLDFHICEIDLKVKSLHPDLDGLRILQLSDVHLGAYLTAKEFSRVIDASNELRANVAVMTGDLISTWGDPIDACLAQLKRVRSDTGMVGCLGNHELYTQSEAYVTRQAAKLGIRFLRHETSRLRFGAATINFAGIDYQPSRNRGHYLRGVAELKSSDALNVLLSHNPDVFPEAVAQAWDITLAGHTHGGQVTLEIFDQTLNPARFYTRYVSGLYQRDRSQCYVTRGIGTIGIPARLGATPEITLVRLRKA